MAELMLMWSVGKSIGQYLNIHIFYKYTAMMSVAKNADRMKKFC